MTTATDASMKTAPMTWMAMGTSRRCASRIPTAATSRIRTSPTCWCPRRATKRARTRLLGQEGFDNDGDGRVNEDGDGFYDPNRDWAWNWQPGLRAERRASLSVLDRREPPGRRLHQGASQHRRGAVLSQHRRHDPPRARRQRRSFRRVRPGRVRADRPTRRADAAGLPADEHRRGSVRGLRRTDRLDARDARDVHLHQRAVHAVQLLPQAVAEGFFGRQEDQRRSTSTCCSATAW